MKLNKKICFDIDNVICETHNSDYKNSKPIYAAINKINSCLKKIQLYYSRQDIWEGQMVVELSQKKLVTILQKNN